MKIKSRELIELAGVFGIIASLIFVGMQLMFDRQLAVAGQFQDRAELRIMQETAIFENSDYIQDLVNDWNKNRPEWWNTEIESIFSERYESMGQVVRQHRNMIIFAVLMDNNYYQYRQGFLDIEFWLDMRAVIKNNLRDPVFRAAITGIGSPSFNELQTTLLKEIDAEID